MDNRQLKYGVLMTYAMGALQILVNLVLTAALVRSLPRVEYGLYLLLGSLVAYISVFDFGLNNTVSRYVAKYKAEGDREKESNLLSVTLIMYLGVALVIVIAGLLLRQNLHYFVRDVTPEYMALAETLFLLLIANLALSLPLGSFAAVLVGYEQFIFTRTVSMLRILGVPVLSIPLLWFGGGSLGVVAVTTAMNVLAGAANGLFAFKKLGVRLRLGRWDGAFFKELAGYSGFIFLGVMADQLFWNTGNVVVGLTDSPAAVSVYGTANQLCTYFVAIVAAMAGVFLPRSTRLVVQGADRRRLSEYFIRIGRLQAVLICLIAGGFLVLGQEFVAFWLEPGYNKVYLITAIIMIPLALNLSKAVALSIMQAKNLHGFRSVLLLATGLLNLAASYFAAKRFGIVGVACCLSATLLIGNVILDFYYDKRVDIDIPGYYKNVLPIALCTLGAALVALMGNMTGLDAKLLFLVKGVLFVGAFGVFFWLFASNPHEKSMLSDFVRGARRRRADKK